MENVDKCASIDVTDRDVKAAAKLLIALDDINCTHVLSEKFQNLVAHYGLCVEADDQDGAKASLEDIEHFICYPYSDD